MECHICYGLNFFGGCKMIVTCYVLQKLPTNLHVLALCGLEFCSCSKVAGYRQPEKYVSYFYVLGLFPFVRTGRPDPSVCK